MKFIKQRNKLPLVLICLVSVSILALISLTFFGSRFNPIPQIVSSTVAVEESQPFPDVNTSELTPVQGKIIALLKQEYATQPDGTKYSEGIKEAWCADFVSWIFKEAGQPLSNQNSGSWRIPGTYTLREYYETSGKFKSADSGYTPKVGDIMLYDNPSPFGQHTNMVIKNESGVITTIGGNEPGGIRIYKHTQPDEAGFIGYGVLS
ncbi:CHAP domain-containing protein [Candidatus Saccharibacteria bacterium]|nr:CHAP domain-containing protein [Candidatus Saccharibacteria bacterium]